MVAEYLYNRSTSKVAVIEYHGDWYDYPWSLCVFKLGFEHDAKPECISESYCYSYIHVMKMLDKFGLEWEEASTWNHACDFIAQKNTDRLVSAYKEISHA